MISGPGQPMDTRTEPSSLLRPWPGALCTAPRAQFANAAPSAATARPAGPSRRDGRRGRRLRTRQPKPVRLPAGRVGAGEAAGVALLGVHELRVLEVLRVEEPLGQLRLGRRAADRLVGGGRERVEQRRLVLLDAARAVAQ